MTGRTTARDSENCYDCIFWRENERSYHGYGFCRRSSPLSRMNEVETSRSYWCAEWRDRRKRDEGASR